MILSELRLNLIAALSIFLCVSSAQTQVSDLLKDIRSVPTSSESSYPRDLINFKGSLYFVALGAAGGIEFWRSDGTSEETASVRIMYPNGSLGVLQGQYYYYHNNPQWVSALDESLIVKGGAPGALSLWRSDGTAEGTALLKNFTFDLANQTGFVRMGNEIFFNASDSQYGNELWKTDGTVAGTKLVKDINTMPGINIGSSWLQGLTALPTKVIFYAVDFDTQNGLWSSDGTSSGTIFLTPMSSYFRREVVGSKAFILGSDGVQNGLWVTDGTHLGTRFLKDFPSTNGAPPKITLSHLGTDAILAVVGEDAAIWRSDGTVEGTVLVDSFDNNSYEYDELNFVEVAGNLYFTLRANAPFHFSLFKTDGTSSGTGQVDFLSGNWAIPYRFNGELILKLCPYTLLECDLHRSTGQAYGTTIIEGLDEPSKTAYQGSIQIGDRFVFAYNNGVIGEEPWVMTPPDDCPEDPQKFSPGICGCGTADTDIDSDGELNCREACPEDPEKTEQGACGCGSADLDISSNSVMDCFDPALYLSPPAPQITVDGRSVTISMPSYQNVKYDLRVKHTVKRKPGLKRKKKIKIFNYSSSASTVQFPGMPKGRGTVIYSISTGPGPSFKTPDSSPAQYKIAKKKKSKN